MQTNVRHVGVMSAALAATISAGAITDGGGARVPVASGVSAGEAGGWREVQVAGTGAQAGPTVFEFRERPTQWTRTQERRFRELAEAEALGSIRSAAHEELERLAAERRCCAAEPSAEELLHRIRQQRATEELLAALQKYVRLYPRTGPAGRPAGKAD